MTSLPVEPWEQRLRALHLQAREIFARALQTASIPAAFDLRLGFEDGVLMRKSPGGDEPLSRPLSTYKRIYIVAVGKAALPMLDALLERLPGSPAIRGICCAPTLPERMQPNIRYYAGGHPSPNRDSFRSARAALRLLHGADAPRLLHSDRDSFVFFLISGGGSSLFDAPLDQRITFADTIAFHRALVGCGATIAEINTVRKHFSAVKGGRLAAAAGAAAKFTLLVSDVPAVHLDALASGPTLPDRSTVAECRAIIERYQLLDRFPPRVRNFFADPDLPETPGEKIPHSGFTVLLSNDELIHAASIHAESLGWKVFIDNSCDDWDYRAAARYLLDRLYQLRREHGRVCLLSGGEVTVRLEGTPGAGGRNQQLALACALDLAEQPEIDPRAPIAILSAGSDGVDGLSPAAGAIADPSTVARALALGLYAAAALRSFNSYPFFTALGDTVVTGPTNNNLRDLRILLSC